MDVNIFVEFVQAFFLVFYHMFVALFDAVVPLTYRKKKNISGDIVVVTGAGSGIGRLISQRLSFMGCTLVLWDINEKGNEETAQGIKENGGRAFTYTVDCSKREKIKEAAQKVKDDVGEVDILINNAGIVTGKNFLETTDEMSELVMDININAHFWTVKSFLPSMLERNHGHVVTIASAAGVQGCAGLLDYCASKYAAVGFNDSLREELKYLKKADVHTTVVCPYFIDTGMFDGVKVKFPKLLPLLKPEYVADEIVTSILTNREVLIMPRLVGMMLPLRAYLPVKSSDAIISFFGTNQSMETFKGRGKKED